MFQTNGACGVPSKMRHKVTVYTCRGQWNGDEVPKDAQLQGPIALVLFLFFLVQCLVSELKEWIQGKVYVASFPNIRVIRYISATTRRYSLELLQIFLGQFELYPAKLRCFGSDVGSKKSPFCSNLLSYEKKPSPKWCTANLLDMTRSTYGPLLEVKALSQPQLSLLDKKKSVIHSKVDPYQQKK